MTEFSLNLGLYDDAFTRTLKYDALLIERPAKESAESCWHHLSTTSGYDPHRSKGTRLWSPVHRYIHHLLSHSLTGREDSTRVVSRRDFNYLLSMVVGFRLCLGYEIALAIHHQAIDSRVEAIFIGPCISLLIRGMGLQGGLIV